MKFTNLFALIAVVFASFIQVGCGNQQGNCASGQTFQNGVCTSTAPQIGYNPTGSASCSYGPSYVANYGSCQVGYVMQGNSCVCQQTPGVTQPGVTNNQCQNPSYHYLNYPQYGISGCFEQGQCAAGYAYHTPTGYCVKY